MVRPPTFDWIALRRCAIARLIYVCVYCLDSTLNFDPDSVYDQNRRSLFKRLKIFAIIKQPFDREEGVMYLSVSTCLAARRREFSYSRTSGNHPDLYNETTIISVS